MSSHTHARSTSRNSAASACGESADGCASPRALLVQATIVLIAGGDVEPLTIPAICAEAELDAQAFENSFAGLAHCVPAAFDELECLLSQRVREAVRGVGRWEDRVRAALMSLLGFAEENPRLAQFMLPTGARESLTSDRCERLRSRLADALEQGRPVQPADVPAAAFGANAVIAAAAAILHAKLSEAPLPSLRELAGPLAAMIVLPYLGADGARAALVGCGPEDGRVH